MEIIWEGLKLEVENNIAVFTILNSGYTRKGKIINGVVCFRAHVDKYFANKMYKMLGNK